jgi:translation initiation factor IF-3
VNRQIRAREVQLIDQDGTNHGVIPIAEAVELAREARLDLVEVAPNADPPVCRILDFGKFAYERTKKERQARKQQKKIEVKTIRLSIDTADFHRDIKVRNARRWLEEGKKVKVSLRFYGREITRPEIGQDMMSAVLDQLTDIAEVEQEPNMEGRRMIMLLSPS